MVRIVNKSIIIYNDFAYKSFSLNINKVITRDNIHDILGVKLLYEVEFVTDAVSFINIKNQFKRPGIYGIYCIKIGAETFVSASGKIYIGAAVILVKRLMEHLNSNKDNALTKAIKTYGLSNIQVVVFKSYPNTYFDSKEQLDLVLANEEQWFLDNVEPERLFNRYLLPSTLLKFSSKGNGKGKEVSIKNTSIHNITHYALASYKKSFDFL